MALVNLPLPVFIPSIEPYSTTAPALSTATNIGTIGYGAGMVFQTPITDTITKICFRTSAINAGTLQVRVETVNPATGINTGTLWAANTNATVVVTNADDNKWYEVSLTSAASVNQGEFVAIIVQADTASIGTIQYIVAGMNTYSGPPYGIVNITGSWAGSTVSSFIFGCVFGTAGYIHLERMIPIQTISNDVYNSVSTPDCRGNAFTPTFNCKVSGVGFVADLDEDVLIRLYDTDGVTVLAEGALSDYQPPITTQGLSLCYFDGDASLTAGNTYYISIEPQSTANIRIYRYTFGSTDLKKIYIDATLQACSAKDPSGVGSWTVKNTDLSLIFPMISAVDDGSGGGGGGFVGSGLLRGSLG